MKLCLWLRRRLVVCRCGKFLLRCLPGLRRSALDRQRRFVLRFRLGGIAFIIIKPRQVNMRPAQYSGVSCGGVGSAGEWAKDLLGPAEEAILVWGYSLTKLGGHGVGVPAKTLREFTFEGGSILGG